jgi:hypothetical protein
MILKRKRRRVEEGGACDVIRLIVSRAHIHPRRGCSVASSWTPSRAVNYAWAPARTRMRV